ncbi:MAG: efflux RND transporter permease subunit [Saprospiraceae bacterium]
MEEFIPSPKLPIDAVPDITNNQVQVVTVANSLAPQEVEQFITYPIEVSVSNIPNVTEIRSISRYGLSVITIVFEDKVPILEARQFVKEQLSLAAEEIPHGMGSPELMPITTGLGEIYTNMCWRWIRICKINTMQWSCVPFRIGLSKGNWPG